MHVQQLVLFLQKFAASERIADATFVNRAASEILSIDNLRALKSSTLTALVKTKKLLDTDLPFVKKAIDRANAPRALDEWSDDDMCEYMRRYSPEYGKLVCAKILQLGGTAASLLRISKVDWSSKFDVPVMSQLKLDQAIEDLLKSTQGVFNANRASTNRDMNNTVLKVPVDMQAFRRSPLVLVHDAIVVKNATEPYRRSIWMVGTTGAGKSTLVRELLDFETRMKLGGPSVHEPQQNEPNTADVLLFNGVVVSDDHEEISVRLVKKSF